MKNDSYKSTQYLYNMYYLYNIHLFYFITRYQTIITFYFLLMNPNCNFLTTLECDQLFIIIILSNIVSCFDLFTYFIFYFFTNTQTMNLIFSIPPFSLIQIKNLISFYFINSIHIHRLISRYLISILYNIQGK